MIRTMNGYDRRRDLARTVGVVLLCLALMILAGIAPAHAVRLKDIASFSGVRNNELVGYGLVVGLSGSGDGNTSEFTLRSMANMLEKMGVSVNPATLKPKNTAAVMVTAKMPASARPGSPLDVTISSMGDAKSLLGGVLLLTPLRGLDGRVYAVAQGSMTLGGYSAEGQATTAQKNITTVARIPNGATVEREVAFQFNKQEFLTVNMANQDFGTTMQVVGRINSAVGGQFAKAVDGATIQIAIPPKFHGNMVPLVASLENLDVSPDSRARVVVDEKTGTVVLGGNVRLNKVAVAHGNLQIVVAESPNVSQPGAFASSGQTVVTPQTDVKVKEQNNRLLLMEGATLQELVDGLNSVGATPRDLISILRTLKTAGSLHADLEVI